MRAAFLFILALPASAQQLPLISPSSLNFKILEAGFSPPVQVVTLSSTVPTPFEIRSSESWLHVAPEKGIATESVSVFVTSPGSPAGTYSASLTLVIGSNHVSIPVTLEVVVNPRVLRFSDSSEITFDYQKGMPLPAPRAVAFTSRTGLPFAFTSFSDSPWIAITPGSGSTPAPLTLSLVSSAVANLPTGTFSGTVFISTLEAANQHYPIQVTLRVSEKPVLMASDKIMTFGALSNRSNPLSQTRLITTSGGNPDVKVTIESPGRPGWLFATLDATRAPATLTVTAVPSALDIYLGQYRSYVHVIGPNNTLVIPADLYLVNSPLLNLNRSELSFTSANRFAPQTLQLTSSSANFGYTVTSTATWLSVASPTGVTPAPVTVSVDRAQLAEGTHYATLVVLALGADNPIALVPVSLTVGPPEVDLTLRASPANLTFSQIRGAPAVAAQTVQVTSAQPLPYRVTTAILSPAGSDWLVVSQPSSQTNSALQVALAPSAAALPVGNYAATIQISGPNSPNTIPVEVRLAVTAEPIPTPTISAVVNAATFQAGSLAPGMLVTLLGRNLGPDRGATGEIVGGRFTASTAGVWAYFDGIAAPILYASATQINAIVPYALAGRTGAQLTVHYRNVTSAPIAVRLAATGPGIFTVDGRQAAALNQDGRVNSATIPALAGTVVVLYLTGEGLTTPTALDGEIVTSLKQPEAAVRVRVGGVEVREVLYGGSAPGLVSGLMQLNVRLPAELPSDNATPIEVTVGGAASPTGATIAVR